MLAQLALDPRPLIAGSARQFKPLPLGSRPSEIRNTRRWAAKRLRQLRAVDALRALERGPRARGLRHRISLRQTMRALRKAAGELA
jgi:hypothetical protein